MEIKIEKGQQLGIRKRIRMENDYLWYECAVQKVGQKYYIYENEVKESSMVLDEYEYENIKIYTSLTDVKKFFPNKYKIKFIDLKPLKGQKIFDVNDYIQ